MRSILRQQHTAALQMHHNLRNATHTRESSMSPCPVRNAGLWTIAETDQVLENHSLPSSYLLAIAEDEYRVVTTLYLCFPPVR